MPKRDLSCFHCKELLYEYAVGLLDERRSIAVKDHLSTCEACPQELSIIKAGLSYSDKLGETTISEELVNHLNHEMGFFKRAFLVARAQRWSTSLRWATESLVVAGVVAFGLNYAAQKYFLEKDQQQKEIEEVEILAAQMSGQESEFAISEEDEIEASTPVPAATIVAKGTPAAATPKPVVVAKATPQATPIKPAETPQASPTDILGVSAPKAEGSLYLAFMYNEYLDQITPEIVAKIKALGGNKAGRVELGWRKPKESYFHFTFPEAKQNELLQFLRGYSPVKVDKHAHPRVMPDGIVRFILRVKLPADKDKPEPQEDSSTAEQ